MGVDRDQDHEPRRRGVQWRILGGWVGLGWGWVFVRKQFEVLKLKLEKEWRTT